LTAEHSYSLLCKNRAKQNDAASVPDIGRRKQAHLSARAAHRFLIEDSLKIVSGHIKR
jgi:hypothetical protein